MVRPLIALLGLLAVACQEGSAGSGTAAGPGLPELEPVVLEIVIEERKPEAVPEAVPEEEEDLLFWIDFRISGDASYEFFGEGGTCRESSRNERWSFTFHTEDWNVWFTATGPAEGEPVEAEVTARPVVNGEYLGDDTVHTGTGTISYLRGEEQGLPILEGSFSAPGLSAPGGSTVDLEGEFACLPF